MWGHRFKRWEDEPWATGALERLALKYDTVEGHGWYDNLDLTVNQILSILGPDDVMVDYSGGTGILAQRIFDKRPDATFKIVIADSSPKFLRLALEKFKTNEAVAFRLIRYLKSEKRLQALDECADWSHLPRPPSALVSTNAIHLYYELGETIRSWWRVLGDDARLLVQSGNIRDPNAAPDAWIIDETVEHIHKAAIRVVREQHRFSQFRVFLENPDYMAQHDALRKKYFLPVRPLSTYTEAIEEGGFDIENIESISIRAQVEDWYRFLSVYHEGVLGWAGGAEKVTGQPASEVLVQERLELIRESMNQIFKHSDSFNANWTYITGRRKSSLEQAVTGI